MLKRSAIRIAFAVVLASLAGGCLQPLHAPATRIGGSSAPLLSAVRVQPIEGWVGHQLKGELDFHFSGGAPNPAYRYELRVVTSQGANASLIDVSTGRAQVANLQGTAIYELVEMGSGKQITNGRTFATTSFDRSTQRFATVRAQRDAETRLAKLLAERLRGIITAALLAPGQKAPALPDMSLLEEAPPSKTPGEES